MRSSNQKWASTFTSIVGGIALFGSVGCQAELDGSTFSAVDDIESEQSALHGTSADVILDWNVATQEAITVANGYSDPFDAVRMFAMVHLAMHDAVNGVDSRYDRYASTARDRYASPEAAAAAAAHGVLLSLFPDQQAALDAHLDESLDEAGGYWWQLSRGVELGEQAAAAIVADRQNDGSAVFGEYTPTGEAGNYNPNYPPYFIAYRPAWGQVKPFALEHGAQFRAPEPSALDSEKYAADFAEIQSKGRIDSTTRTADESEYAAFWYEFSDSGWNRVARTVAKDQDLRLWDAARFFALLNMSMADGYIAGVEGKYHYALWRPITAVPAGDSDGNANTVADADWLPFQPTTPVPEYPSTHATLGAAGAHAMIHALGYDTGFTMTSPSALDPNKPRTLASLQDAADENADSRVMAGLHFRQSVDQGLILGQKIADYAFANYLRPSCDD